MHETPTVHSLMLRYQQRLALSWTAGQQGKDRPLALRDDTRGKSLVGHLNVIHPNRIQIIGQLELDYLNNLSPAKRQLLIQECCENRPAIIILAEGIQAPEDIRNQAETTRTPLLSSNLNSVKLINTLRHYLGSELAEKAIIHGVFLEVNGMGVLLTGESSVGKSELALELVTRNHRLIADDAPEFSRVGPDTIRGSCPEALRDFLEVRGLGVLNIRAMFGDSAIKLSKDLGLVVHLQRMAAEDMQQVDRLKGCYRKRTILDTEIPEVTLPVALGRNLAVLVEAAVRDHILLRKGYNASEAFINRQREIIQRQQSAESHSAEPLSAEQKEP